MRKLNLINIVLSICSLFKKNQSINQKKCFYNYVPYSGKLTRTRSCMYIISLGILLIFLSSCSMPTQNPSSITDDNFSQTSLVPSPSITPAQNVQHIRPTRPFPDFPPNYLQFVTQEIQKDFDIGTFLVKKDGIATNYQSWYELIGKINKNKDAELTIQTFDMDLSKEANDSTCYKLLSRYRLSVSGNQSSWEYLSDNKDYISGKLSLRYDEKTGIHEILIGDMKVFEFIYFPSDLMQAALYFGYTPLKELPVDYTSEIAIKDGCLVIENGVIQNINVLTKSGDPFADDSGYFLRIFSEDIKDITITDIGFYNDRACISVDYSRHSRGGSMEETYITTYYDNCSLGIGGAYDPDHYELYLSFDYLAQPVFILKDMPIKKD